MTCHPNDETPRTHLFDWLWQVFPVNVLSDVDFNLGELHFETIIKSLFKSENAFQIKI